METPTLFTEQAVEDPVQEVTFVTGEPVLDEVYQRVFDFVTGRYVEYRSEVDNSILNPLRVLCRQLADAHSVVLEDLNNQDETSNLWEVQREYREQVEHAVTEQLQKFLEDEAPATQLISAYQRLLDDLEGHQKRYPAQIQIPESPALFMRDPLDPGSVVVRKWLGRTRTRLTGIGRRIRKRLGRNVTDPVSNVPVADLVAYHLRRRVPAVAFASYRSDHKDLAHLVGSLEYRIAMWFTDVLKIDRILDREETPEEDTTDSQGVETEMALFAEVVAAGKALQEALESLSNYQFPEKPQEGSSFSFAWELFRLGLQGRGTFLSALPIPVNQLGPANSVGGAVDVGHEWEAWHAQVVDRLTMINSLIDLRDEMLSLESELIRDVGKASVSSLNSAFGKLKHQIEEAHTTVLDAGANIKTDDDLAQFRNVLQEQMDRIVKTTSWLASLPGFISADNLLDSAGKESWDSLQKFIDTFPPSLTIHPVRESLAPDPRVGLRTVQMPVSIRQTLHTSLDARLSSSAQPLKREVVSAWGSAERVESIVKFNIDAALEEIESYLNPAADDEGDEPKSLDETRSAVLELAGDGLQRAVTSIDEVTTGVEKASSVLVNKISREFLSDWTVIHQTVRMGNARAEQFEEVWSRLAKRLETTSFKASQWFDKFRSSMRQLIRLGEREARGLIRRGQTAVGVLDQSDQKRAETVRAISNIATLKDQLPIVYRRLFTFAELTAPALLEARSRDLVWLRNFVTTWRNDGGSGVVVIVGEPGSGKSSFLNVLGETAIKNMPTQSVRLDQRIASEADLCKEILSALDLKVDCETLDEVEAVVAKIRNPSAILVDDLEHAFIQTAYGRELFERFMLFLSRNDRRICWILSAGQPAWNYLSRTSGQVVGFATVYKLATIDRSGFDAIITSRHKRSGMPIVFEDVGAATKFTDRLKRVRSDEEKQVMLRDSYFDSLRKASGQNIMLALLYWITSVEFKENGELLVKPLKHLSFEFLGRYESNLAFTLRSLIVHKSLSVDEHNRVFGIGDEQTSFTLERLVNDRVICVAGSDPDKEIAQPERYATDTRFRVHPLVLHPVSAMLLRSNLLH